MHSIVRIARLLGKPFKDTPRVREGAVESPHAFDAYVNDVRTRLEALHPNLCRLMGVMVAIVLYADDVERGCSLWDMDTPYGLWLRLVSDGSHRIEVRKPK